MSSHKDKTQSGCVVNNLKLSKTGNLKSVYYGTETISVLGLKLWILSSDEYKNLASLNKFQTKIKNWDWVPQNCLCSL